MLVGNRVGMMPSMILGLKPCCAHCLVKRGPVGVDHDALHDLAAFFLEEGDLLGEVLARLVVGAADR